MWTQFVPCSEHVYWCEKAVSQIRKKWAATYLRKWFPRGNTILSLFIFNTRVSIYISAWAASCTPVDHRCSFDFGCFAILIRNKYVSYVSTNDNASYSKLSWLDNFFLFPKIVVGGNEKKYWASFRILFFIIETEYLCHFVCSFLRMFLGDLSLTLCKALWPELEEKAL